MDGEKSINMLIVFAFLVQDICSCCFDYSNQLSVMFWLDRLQWLVWYSVLLGREQFWKKPSSLVYFPFHHTSSLVWPEDQSNWSHTGGDEESPHHCRIATPDMTSHWRRRFARCVSVLQLRPQAIMICTILSIFASIFRSGGYFLSMYMLF